MLKIGHPAPSFECFFFLIYTNLILSCILYTRVCCSYLVSPMLPEQIFVLRLISGHFDRSSALWGRGSMSSVEVDVSPSTNTLY